MKAMVVYQSKHGNCEQIAKSILKGLADAGVDVTIADVKTATAPGEDTDLLVLGSATRAGRAMGRTRKYAEDLEAEPGGRLRFAAFGTGMASLYAKEPEGTAAVNINGILRDKGLEPAAKPLVATVQKYKGPLTEGAVEKAYEWGKELGSALATPVPRA
ncbi:MAG TPA: flavodoxin domain-containing protein [Candidatus Anoxymicrobiaceae bacterium]